MMLSPDINRRLIRGEIVPVGHRMYAICRGCRSLIRVNKPLLGSLHICEEPEVRVRRAAER